MKNKVGEKYISNEGYTLEIIKYNGCFDCVVKVDNNAILENVEYGQVKKGQVKNPLSKSVFNVGFVGQGNFRPTHEKNMTKEYRYWKSMLQRCYYKPTQDKQYTYKGVTVCEEWHNFQNFAKWFEKNYVEGWHLDKDIICPECKEYAPENCAFVPREINNLLNNRRKNPKYPVGVEKSYNKYQSNINKWGQNVYLGYFNTVKEAYNTYVFEKEKYIKEVADKWKGKIDEKVYEAMYGWKIKNFEQLDL